MHFPRAQSEPSSLDYLFEFETCCLAALSIQADLWAMDSTLEWFGTTTFRLRTKGLTIFLDTWLERPSVLPQYLSLNEVREADYIIISHAHFDQCVSQLLRYAMTAADTNSLPGADLIALKTGAIVIANGEAINVLRSAGVPDEQLVPVAGGERVPLFSQEVRNQADRGEGVLADGPPAAPRKPHHSRATMSVHVWPSLHCLMPGLVHADVPEIMDTGKPYIGAASQYACTLDITFGMKHGLLRMGDLMPRNAMNDGMRSFVDYVADTRRHRFSNFDGGQLAFNFLIDDKALLWNAHLGGYEGILRSLEPKPDVLIQAIAGRANLNGRPFDGSAAEFAVDVCKWLGEPSKVIWCLHDDSPIKPFRVDVEPATDLVQERTSSRVFDLRPAILHSVFR
ncbi:hypothetical protein LTS10_000071 [Elasticomyces elasticus]|nr:hypothetical protein LTS10_000071 [Elasticomyces elasticus]